MYNKKNGVYYTPADLAEYLAEPLVCYNDQSILDPSYGEGSLLLAAEKIHKQKNIATALHLFGCDTKPLNGLLKHLPEANLRELDFFDYSIDQKFQTILMNPPYVRRHIQDLKKIEKYRGIYKELSVLNNKADLWAFFLVKAVCHLTVGGGIGAILPWAFLQADYSKKLRIWLAENFKEIKVVALRNKYFTEADERVVILWLTNYGSKNTSIQIGASQSIAEEFSLSEVSYENWSSDRVIYSEGNNIDFILNSFKSEFGFLAFSNFADVKIGVVTGAVDYFILSKEEANDSKFEKKRLIPILTSADEFSDYISNGKRNLSMLLALKDKDHLKYRKFIKSGIEDEIDQTAHSENRKPWYAVKVGETPDAFFHYRTSKIPFLVPNTYRIQCTNAIHRIYYDNLSETEKKWLVVSILSAPSQLSIERNSKTYGRGIIKIEPSSLKNALVLKRNDKSVDSIYNQIIQLLSQSKKDDAMKIASAFIYERLKIPQSLITLTEQSLSSLQSLRLGNKK